MLIKKLVCSSCGVVNDDDANFCKNCGEGARISTRVGSVESIKPKPFQPFGIGTRVMSPDDFKVYTNGIKLPEDGKSRLLGGIEEMPTARFTSTVSPISPFPAKL